MRFQKVACMGLLLLGGAGYVQGQWIPVTAKIREIHETWQAGKLVKVDHKEGVFYRTSDGSTLNYWTSVNGDEALGGQGETTDNRSLTHYSVNMKKKYAFELSKLPERVTPDSYQNAAASTLGDQEIEGVRCRRSPVFFLWPDGRLEKMGETCVSIEYGLELRKDHQLTQDGVTRHSVTEMYDIKLGIEPDAKLFDLQRNASVFKQQNPDSQPKP
jgi:hypothetical protein